MAMEYIYAALLLHRLNKEITEESVAKVVKAAGVEPDEIRIKALVTALGEVDIDEALKTPMVAPTTTPTVAAQPTPTPEAPKPEEKEEEKKEEEALEGLSALFG